MRSRWLVVLLTVLALVAEAPAAWSYYVCETTITVYSGGGQSCAQTCHFYSNETGEYQGYWTREYQC